MDPENAQRSTDETSPATDAPLLEARKLVLDLGGKRILDEVTLGLRRGETLCVLGPSGSGKSQLLRSIVRLSGASGGSVLLEGRPVDRLPPVELRRAVVLVQQEPAMLEGTVEDNIRYGLDLAGIGGDAAERRVRSAIEAAFLDNQMLTRRAESLSGGERQRVALARALALEPHLLLLDEPTAALDPRATQMVEGAIKRLKHERGLAMIVVTHDVDQARRLGDRTVLLRQGRVIAQGDSSTFLERLDPEERGLFLGELGRWEEEHEEADEDD